MPEVLDLVERQLFAVERHRDSGLEADHVVFDARLDTHHHFIDDETGAIHDVPWERVQVCNVDQLTEYRVDEYMVIMRGKTKTTEGVAEN